MNNVIRVVSSGMCTGCNACSICENITFSNGPLGFPIPVVSAKCTNCGRCLSMCIYAPENED